MFQVINFILIHKSGKVVHMKRKLRRRNMLSFIKSNFEIDLWQSFQKYWDVDKGDWNFINDEICLLDLPFLEKTRLFFVKEYLVVAESIQIRSSKDITVFYFRHKEFYVVRHSNIAIVFLSR